MKTLVTNPSQISYNPSGTFEETRFERLHNVIFESAAKASVVVAQEIAALIRLKQEKNEICVLGLATGSSPISVYKELVRLHNEEGLSFKNVISFNLDEYLPMSRESIHSYHYFMHQHLFDLVDIKKENIHIPNGQILPKKVREYCIEYEQKIKDAGGIDFQLLGIGRTGHIGFNEPGSHFNSSTRMVTLDHLTRFDASASFLGIENVPRQAITMGVRTVRKARRIVMLAWGQNKSGIIKEAIEGDFTAQVPASYLQQHKNTTVVLDLEAASALTRMKTPWLVGSCDWNKKLKHQAVVWLCEKTQKSVLKLTQADYNEHGMADLLDEQSVYDLNIEVFNKLQHTITGWPGGKPDADDTRRPERERPRAKRVIVFSPHPDDDVISMGGTLDRLISQGHEVHVAYQTSGNIAVSNEDALKFLEVAFELADTESAKKLRLIKTEMEQAKENMPDSDEVRKLKALIRQKESLGATRFLGLPDSQVHFLQLPFYETGNIKKAPPITNRF